MEKIVGTMLGPASAGKDTVLRELCDQEGYGRIVNDTTRQPRPGESEGVEYYFVSEESYKDNISTGLYFTTNQEKGRSYGVRWAELHKSWNKNLLPVGHFGMGDHENLWSMNDDGLLVARSIFLTVPSFEIWLNRMGGRVKANFISEQELHLRAREATREYKFLETNLGRFAVVASIEGQLSRTVSACSEYLLNGTLPPQDNEPIEAITRDFAQFVSNKQ